MKYGIRIGDVTLKNKGLIATIIFGLLTAGMTAAVKFYDVAAIGPAGTSVGFSTLNKQFADYAGVNMFWFNLAEILGLVIIAICAVFAVMGLVQWIKRRNLLKVDSNILVLGGMYLLVFLLYVLFTKVAICYRPVLMEGEAFPEPSFPSSHTMMACVVLMGAILQLKYYIDKKAVRVILTIVMLAIMMLTVYARLMSGAHWMTDIIAALLYSFTLVSIYCAVMNAVGRKDYSGTSKDVYVPKH